QSTAARAGSALQGNAIDVTASALSPAPPGPRQISLRHGGGRTGGRLSDRDFGPRPPRPRSLGRSQSALFFGQAGSGRAIGRDDFAPDRNALAFVGGSAHSRWSGGTFAQPRSDARGCSRLTY